MSDAHERRAESETEVIPAVGEDVARTRELPPVQDETVVAPPPIQDETVVAPPPPPVEPRPSSAPPPAPQEPTTPAAAPRQSPAPIARPAPEPAPALPPPAAGRGGRGGGWRNAFLALVAVLVVAAVAGVVVARDRLGSPTPGAGESGAAVAVPATITSFDPSGGSGFRQESGATWRTQTYQTAAFGNLKDGVGLLLDLGFGRGVTTVTLEVVGGPIAVELRAGDERTASARGLQRVASADSASGPTTLTPKDAGKHRYWLVWVTRLASQDGGYRAVIRAPAVKARRS